MIRVAIGVAGMLAMWPAAVAAQGYNPNGNAAQMNRESYANAAGRPGGVGIPPDQDTKQSFTIYDQMRDYGRCAAKVSKRRVRDALAEVSDTASERAMFRDIVATGQACRGTGFSPVMSLNRGVLAEGLYHQGAGKTLAYGPLQPTDAGYAAFMAAEKVHNANLQSNDQAVMEMADCLAAQQPALVDEILGRPHGSTEEAQAIAAVFATAPACAGPTPPARFSRSYLRAFLANAAYRYQLFRTPS